MSTLSVVLLSVQWGMIFLLAFLHLIIGAKRGITKTLYYTIISLIITALAIIGISFISVQAFLPAGGLIEFVEWFLPKPIDEAYRVYLVDPEQNGIFVALIDLVVKLLAFYMIYPLIKWILTTTLFKKFWTEHEHHAIIRHIENIPAGEPIKKRIQAPSRFGGGFIGFLRGLITGWVLVMPLIVLVGAINPGNETTLSSPRDEQQLSVSPLNQSGSVIDEWMTLFTELNQKGPGKITSQIMIQNEKAEVKLFDYLFTVQVKSPYYDPMDLSLGSELHRVGSIASTAYQRGYLDDQFDIGTINYNDDFQAIEQILALIGETKLLPMITPTAVDFAMNFPSILDLLGFDPTENEYTADLIEQLKVIDWENEASALTLTIENILLAASIGEWLGLVEDPTALFDLSNEQLRHVGHALKSLSQLELLNATPLALEFLLTQDQINNLISWDEDPLTYLHEKLEFLYEEGFLQEDIDRLGDMIVALFAESFADFDYTTLLPLSEDFNAGVYLSEDAGAIIHLLLQEITKIETILHTIPVAVDYFVYTTNNATVEEIADEISQLFNQPDSIYREEFSNVDSIYQHLISMGLDRLFGDDELIEVVDQILLQDGNFNHARQIINLIFEESHFVGEVLELVAEPIVEQLIADEDLLDIVKNVIFENDFQYGQELVTILNLSETFYQFSSLQTITDQLNRDAYLEVVSSLANLSGSQFRALKRELFNLQLLVASPELLLYAQDKMNLDILSIPENISQASIELDLRMLLDLGYEVATHIKTQGLGEAELNTVNLLDLLPYETVKTLLTFDSVQHQNSILLSTVVQYVKDNPIDLGSLGTIALPEGWEEADFNSSIWVNEINHIIQGILNLGETYAEANLYHFSLQNLSEITSLDDIPVSLITLLTDEGKVDHAFGRILNSTLLKFNAVNIAKQIIEDNEAIPSFTFEDDYYLTDDLNSENLSELIKVGVQLFSEVISSPSKSLGYNLEIITPTILLTTFNEVDIQLIDRFAYQLTINNLFRNVLLDDAVHQMAYDLINNNIQIEHLAPITSGLFDFDVSLDAEGRLKVETLSEIFRYVRHLSLPNHFFILSPAKQTEAIYDLINEDNLDELFSISLIHELTSNIVKLEQVKALGEAYFDLGLEMLENQQLNITTTYERYYDRLFDVLVKNDGLIRVEELQNYVKAFITTREYNFTMQTLNRGSYNRISREILSKTYLDKNLIHYVTDTLLVRALLDELLNDEVLLQSVAELINNEVKINGETVLNLSHVDLQLEARFFDEEGMDGTHLYTLFEALLKQDLEIATRGGVGLRDINNLIAEADDKTKLEYLYDAEILTSLVAQVIENEQVNQTILDFANDTLSTMLTARGLTYEPLTTDDFRLKYDYVNYEATKQMLYTITQLNINNFNELTSIRKVDDVREILDFADQRDIVDEVVQIPLVFALYESLVTNDMIASLLAEATTKLVVEPLKLPVGTIQASFFHLDEKYINHQALADLLIAVLGVQFDVDSPFAEPSFLLELLEPVQVVGVEQNSIYHLFSSNIIHETIDKLLQSETVRSGLASRINTLLDQRQLGATFTAEMFIVPEDALDDEGRIHPREFVTFVEAATRLNIASYSDLSQVTQVDRFIDFIPTTVFDKLFDSVLIHHAFDVALQSDQTRVVIANLANRSLNTNAFNPNDLIIPSDLLDHQERIKKLDLMTIVESLYMTDLTNFSVQMTNPRDLEVLLPLQAVEHLFTSELVQYSVTNLLQGDASKELFAELLNRQLRAQNVRGTRFNAEDFDLPETLLNPLGYIKTDDILILVETFYNLGIDSFSSISMNNPRDIETVIGVPGLDFLLTSELIKYTITKLTQSGQTRELLAQTLNQRLNVGGVRFSAADFLIPETLLDGSGYVKTEDILILAETFYHLGIDTFSSIPLTNPRDIETIIDVAGLDFLLTSELIHYAITKLTQSDASREAMAQTLNQQFNARNANNTNFKADDFLIPENLLNESGYIKKEDILILAETFYNLGIDSFSSIPMNNPRDIETIIDVPSLDFLFTSELIHYTITKLTQSEPSRAAIASILNQQLSNRNLGGTNFTANDFLIPENLLDGSGYIKIDDLLILAETFYNLGIDSFSSIPLTNPRDIEYIIGVPGLDFLLTSELMKYSLTKLTQDNKSRSIIADLLNQQLSNRNLSGANFRANDFLIPEALLDNTGYIKTEDILILAETFYNLGIDSFSSIPMTNPRDIEYIIDVPRLDFLFTSELVQYSVTKLTQHESSRNLIASTLNKQLGGRGLSGANYHANDFLVPEDLLDPSGYLKTTDILLLADTFYNLGIDSFSSIPMTNPHDIEVILSLNVLDALINDSDLYHYYIDLLIQSESTRQILANLLNQLAQNGGVDLTLTASSFTIPEEALVNGQVIRSDIVDFVAVFYRLGIENFSAIVVQGPKDVEAIMDVALFDEMMEIALVYHVTNKLLMGQAVKAAVASLLNSQVQKQGLDLTVKAEQVKVPINALIDGRIRKDELAQLLTIFYELNIDTFSELGQISTIGQMKTIIDEAYFALMLESEIIYYLVGYVSQTEKVRNQLASTVSRYLLNGMDLDMPLIGDDFLFDQHDVIIDDGAYEGYLKKQELTQFYHSLYIFDTDQIRGANLETTVELLTDELLRTYAPNTMVIDEMLESHMMWTLFDRILNVDANERIEQGVLAYLSRFIANAGYGSLNFKAEDHLFRYHASALTPEGYVKREEIVKLIMSIDQIDLADGPSIRMLTDMVDANIDGFGRDDFDRFYESMIIQSLVSNMMLNERFIDGATKEVNKRQGRFNFTPELLYIPQEVIDDGLIFETEVKQLVKTFIILDIYEPDVSYITIALFTDLLDRNDDGFEDDLDRFLSSFIIFTYIDRVMKSDSLNVMVTKQANDALDKNVGAVNTSLTPDMVDGNGMFSKNEIRSLLTSIRLLDLETFGDLNDLGLIDILLLDNANDDLGTFLDSHYIRVMISRMVTSETIRTRIANAADFDVEALDLEATEKDPYGNLTKAETKQLFVALNTLAINDFNTISINNATMKDLTEEELDIVLVSNYFYQVIDLKMKVELDDKVTPVSLVQDGTVYHDYIKKTEIHGLFEALAVLDLDQTDAIDADHISIRQLKDLIAIDSYILRILISDAIVEHLDVPEVSKDVNGTMTIAELNNLITALEMILQDEDATIGSVDMTTLTLTTLQFNDLLNVGFDVDPVEGSPIVKRLISEQVIDVFGNRLDPNAYRTPKDIYHAELVFLKDALFELDILEITGDLNLEEVSIANVYNIHLYDSLILNRLISDEIVLVVDDMPTDAYDAPMVRYEEVGRLFRAMLVLNEPISGLDNLNTNVLTFTTIEIMRQEESLIIDRYISNALIGEPSIVTTNALDLDGHVQTIEITKLVAALNSIHGVDTVDEFVDFLVQTNDIFVLQPLLLTDSIILIDTVQARIIELLP
ncbi:MAG: hypothetical protein WC225_03475 [Acholeplasmataceae bacterium]|nr:hypothetical protein [Acholeplasmataceae bacterium]